MAKGKKPTHVQLEALVATGGAERVEVVVHGYRLTGKKNVFWRTDLDEILDKFIVVRDVDGVGVRELRKSGLSRFAANIRKALAAVLVLKGKPIIGKLLGKIGLKRAPVLAVLDALKKKSSEDQVRALLGLAPSTRWAAVYDAYLEAHADGKVTAKEALRITNIARGKTK